MTTERREYLALVSGAAAALAGCSSGGTDTTTEPEETTAATTAAPLTDTTVELHTEDVDEDSVFYFDPVGVHVAPGTTVTFEVKSGSHSTTAYAKNNPNADTRRIPDDADAWDSAVMKTVGETFEHTFSVEGTYDFYCIPHKPLGMVGRVVCGDPGGPAEGSMPPDGTVPTSDRILREGAVSHADFSD